MANKHSTAGRVDSTYGLPIGPLSNNTTLVVESVEKLRRKLPFKGIHLNGLVYTRIPSWLSPYYFRMLW